MDQSPSDEEVVQEERRAVEAGREGGRIETE